MELAKSPPKAPPTPPAKSPRKRKTSRTSTESATVRELRKWYFYQKAVDVYGGMRRRFDLMGTIGDKLSGSCDQLCKSALSTDLGTAADDIVAMGVRQANVATMRVSSPMPTIQASLVRAKERLVRGAIHYFPLFVLARWAVDLTLVMACLTLALMKDVFRIADGQKDFVYSEETNAVVMQPAREWRGVDSDDEEQDGTAYADGSPVVSPNDANKSARAVRMRMSPSTATARPASVEKSPAIASPAVENQNEYGGQDGEDVRGDNYAAAAAAQDGNVREVDNRNLVEYIEGFKREHSDIASVMQSLLDKVRSAACYILVITIPVVILKICTLRFLSKRVHNLTEGFDAETMEDCKRRQEMFHRLIGTQPEANNLKPLGPNKWLLDMVIDHYLASLMKWMIIGRVLACFVSRPVNLFARLTKANREMLYLRNEAVDYLKEDPDYDEDQDPDYKPEDDDGVVEDSLEYKDDAELEPDELTENIEFDSTQPNQTVPARNMSTTRKKTSASKNPVESEYLLSADAMSPGDSSPRKLASNAQTSQHGKRKSGVQATSTPKDEWKKMDNQGKSAKEKGENATTKSLSFEEEEPIILAPLPLSPERLKRIQMRRDPIQAAVMRMKADRIIEHRRRMKERKQELKNKTKPRLVIQAKNSYEVIKEAQEGEPGESLDTDLMKSDCSAQNNLRNDEADDGTLVSPCDKQPHGHNNTPNVNTRSKSEADSANLDIDAPEYIIEKAFPKSPKGAEHQEFLEWLRENASNTPSIARKQVACDSSQDNEPKAICILSSPNNGSEATLKSSETADGKESPEDPEISSASDNTKLSEGFSPKSLEEKATAPPSPKRSSDLHDVLEAAHDKRSSSVDTGQSVAGW